MIQESFFYSGSDDGSLDSDGAPPPPPSKPPCPDITCYSCGNKPFELAKIDYWNEWRLLGNCCGKKFDVVLTHDKIREFNIKSYVVNLG